MHCAVNLVIQLETAAALAQSVHVAICCANQAGCGSHGAMPVGTGSSGDLCCHELQVKCLEPGESKEPQVRSFHDHSSRTYHDLRTPYHMILPSPKQRYSPVARWEEEELGTPNLRVLKVQIIILIVAINYLFAGSMIRSRYLHPLQLNFNVFITLLFSQNLKEARLVTECTPCIYSSITQGWRRRASASFFHPK